MRITFRIVRARSFPVEEGKRMVNGRAFQTLPPIKAVNISYFLHDSYFIIFMSSTSNKI
jgi:hypothetical protein